MKCSGHAVHASLLAMLLLGLTAGCETEPSGQASITITPGYASIKQGQAIVFKASGWTDYRWSLSDSSLGILDHTTGSSVTYTAVADSTNLQTLAVYGGVGTTNSLDLTSTVLIQHELLNPPPEAEATALMAY